MTGGREIPSRFFGIATCMRLTTSPIRFPCASNAHSRHGMIQNLRSVRAHDATQHSSFSSYATERRTSACTCASITGDAKCQRMLVLQPELEMRAAMAAQTCWVVSLCAHLHLHLHAAAEQAVAGGLLDRHHALLAQRAHPQQRRLGLARLESACRADIETQVVQGRRGWSEASIDITRILITKAQTGIGSK